MPVFDLKKNLVFYGAYHREPTNVAIHIACVPVLLATGILFGTNTPTLPVRQHPLLTRLNLPLNAGTIAAATYSTLYLLLSPNIAGVTVTPIILAFASLSNRLTQRYNKTKVNSIAVAVHVVSWILQFVGHGKFEGRKPALLDNLVQALFLAPLFVWYEVLFKMGFYKGLKRDVQLGIEAEIAKLKAKKADKGKGIALDDNVDTVDDVVDAVLDEEKEGSDEVQTTTTAATTTATISKPPPHPPPNYHNHQNPKLKTSDLQSTKLPPPSNSAATVPVATAVAPLPAAVL